MITDKLRKAWRFFHANAGYIVGRRAECALDLARAEQWAREEGVEVQWVPDPEPYQMGDAETRMPSEVYGCILTHGDEQASLWSIGDPDADYRRVVEAELASELQTNFFTALGRHIRQL